MTAEGANVDANLSTMAVGRDHGHYFVKKTFGKPTYCHHCCDKIWGMLSQGFACESTPVYYSLQNNFANVLSPF
jgi:diacylglycerol kinase (ATP)